MIRQTAAVIVMLSGAAFAQSAESVCATLVMSGDKVACLQAVAGHTVEPAAARVCSSIMMSSDKTACLIGALDKHYDGPELQACSSILMGGDKANCVASTGARFQAPPRERDRRRDDGYGPGAQPIDRLVRLTNQHRGVIDRFYWRGGDQRRFREVRIPPVQSNTYVDVQIPSVELEVCIETPDGYRLRFPSVRPNDQLLVSARENHWVQGRCAELR